MERAGTLKIPALESIESMESGKSNGVTLCVIALWFVGSVPIGIVLGKAIKRANEDEED